MRRTNQIFLTLLLTGLITATAVFAQNQPTTKPTAPPAAHPEPKDPNAPAPDPAEPIITKMRVQDFPAVNYAYISTETTLEQIGPTVEEIMPKLMAGIKEHKMEINGPSQFVYKGVTQDHTKPFTLEIGFPVAEGTQEAGDVKVRKLEAFHCATVIYSGPISGVGGAYGQLFTELFAGGMTPTGETREMYLYWEGVESPNNVELIMAGVN